MTYVAAMFLLLCKGQHLGTYKYVDKDCITKELPSCGTLVISTNSQEYTKEQKEVFSCRLTAVNKCFLPFEKDDL